MITIAIDTETAPWWPGRWRFRLRWIQGGDELHLWTDSLVV